MGFNTRIFHLLFTLLFTPTSVFSSVVYNRMDDCEYIDGKEIEIQCPRTISKHQNFNEEYLLIRLDEKSQTTKIECHNTRSFRMDLLPNITATKNIKLEIDSCPLPQMHFKQISDHFLMDVVKGIHFRNFANVTLTQRYFKDLQLEKLTFDHLLHGNIEEDAFSNISTLYSLEIENNKNIRLNAKSFRNLPNLKILSLTQNGLSDLPEGLFENLRNLRFLHLANNNLSIITDKIFTDLTNLTFLDLQSNQIETISENAFRSLIHLSEVNLSKNRISNISSNIFKSCVNITKIYMMLNPELKIPEYLFSKLIFLDIVDLSHCNLRFLPPHIFLHSICVTHINLEDNKLETISPLLLRDLKKLEELNLSNNLITVINQTLFKGLTALKIINLAQNRIVKIHQGAFYKMKNLVQINLSHNNLSQDRQLSNILEEIKNVENLDLSYNFITNISDVINVPFKLKLKELNLSHNRITELKLNDLQYGFKVDLNYNNITRIDFESMDHNSDKTTTISISGNPIDCTCNNYELLQFLKREKQHENTTLKIVTEGVSCKTPDKLKDFELVQLPPTEITCDIKNSSACPEECSCSWEPFDTSVVVNCSYRNLSTFPTLDLMELMSQYSFNQTEMHLQGNVLEYGPSENIEGYDNITRLYLSNNRISQIDWLPPNLEVLYLDNNELVSIDKQTLNILNETVLSLHDNPWRCDCQTLTFSNFLRQHRKQVDINNIKCNHKKELLIYNLREGDVCQTNLIFYILPAVLSIFLFTAFLFTLFYRYQEPIKIWLFAHGYLLWWVTEEELDKDKEYDAFVSYSHKDEDFVIRNLLPVLESGQNPYKLCLHYRNWVPGEFIGTQVTNSVLKSRRTLVILSPNFLESVWGKMEFRTAHTQAMTEGRARVIIVLYGEMELEMLDEELKAYMKTNTYVKWGDPYFWNKLKYALPHSNGKIMKHEPKTMNVANYVDEKRNVILADSTTVLNMKKDVLKGDKFVPTEVTL